MIDLQPERVMVVGDWHGNPAWADEVLKYGHRHGVDTVVHVGDYGFWVPSARTHAFLTAVDQRCDLYDMNFFWSRGNHEYQPGLEECNQPGEPEPVQFKGFDRTWFLPDGFRWNWWGLTWMSLGGAHSVDRTWRTEGVDWWPTETLTDAQVEYASRPGGVDLIIAHDAPYGVDIPGIGPPAPGGDFPFEDLVAADEHRRKIRKVVDAVEPSLYFHGHYHRYYTGKLGDMSVFGLDRDGSKVLKNTILLTYEGAEGLAEG